MGVGLSLAEPIAGGDVRTAGCGWMIALMDSGACSTAQEGKARRRCKKEQKRDVDVLRINSIRRELSQL